MNHCNRETGVLLARRILLLARKYDFFSFGILSRKEWWQVLEKQGLAEEEQSFDSSLNQKFGQGEKETPHGQNLESFISRYRLDSFGAMLVVALRYAPKIACETEGERKQQGIPALPHADTKNPAVRIGRFAQANWYKEILVRLHWIAKESWNFAKEEGLLLPPAKSWPRFSNSHFPEKSLALACGLGTVGRNSLLIARKTNHVGELEPQEALMIQAAANHGENDEGRALFSNAVLLGLLMLPWDVPEGMHGEPMPPFVLCGACQRCVEACPSGALSLGSEPRFERRLCLQHYTAREGALPFRIAAAWSDQLYGCDICLEACPHFLPDPTAQSSFGRIGDTLDAHALAQMEDEQIRALFRSSALGLRWISASALRRNAQLAQEKHAKE